MNIIFAGNNIRALKCLEFLLKKKLNIILSIGHPKKKTDKYYFRSIEELSRRNNINFIKPKTLNTQKIYNKIKKLNADLMVLAGYSASILKQKIFSLPKYGTINLHGSLLPKYRGGSPLNWAIINGEKYTGASIIQVDSGIDTGKILIQKKIKINNKDNILSLTKKLNQIFPKLLFSVIKNISTNKIKPKKQKKRLKYFKKRVPEDGLIYFKRYKAEKINNMVRALLPPFPGAFFIYNKKKIIITNMKIIKKNYNSNPGKILFTSKNSLIISTKDYPIKIEKLISLTNKKVSFQEFKTNEQLN